MRRKMNRAHLVILIIGILFIVVGVIIWVINASNAKSLVPPTILIVFSACGTLFSFFQWIFPLDSIQIPSFWKPAPKPSKRKEDFFISYHAVDTIWAEWMDGLLKEKGYTVIYQPWSGHDFVGEMAKASKEAEYTRIILSLDYLTKLKAEPGWLQEFNRRNKWRKKCISFNVHRYKPDIVQSNSGITCINLAGLDENKASDILLQHVPSKLRILNRLSMKIHNVSGKGRKHASAAAQTAIVRSNRSPFPGFTLNVPKHNLFFVRSDNVLNDLYSAFRVGEENGLVLPQVLTGFIGAGKTRTAIEYVDWYRSHYRYVFWLNALSKAELRKDFKQTAQVLNITEKDPQALIAAVKRRLEENADVLLILDRCEDLLMVANFIPQQARSHILLTSRSSYAGQFAPIEIKPLEPAAGAELLLHRAGKKEPSLQDQERAKNISQEMGGLPLALKQAGAYIQETGCNLSEYLTLYEEERAELLKRGDKFSPDYPESVVTALSVSLDEIKKINPAAEQLLFVCAFLYPDSIPIEIITKGAPELGAALEPIADNSRLWNSAITELRSFSLIHRFTDASTNTEMLSVHRLLQAELQDTRMDNAEQREWAERAIRAVNHAFPVVKFGNWQRCQIYQPQVQACAELIKKRNMKFPEAAQLLDQMGCYLRERALYKQAEQFLIDAYSLRQNILDRSDPQIATSMNNLAELYHIQGKYVEAEKLYKEACDIRKQKLGAEHLAVATTLNNLARLYADWGKYDNLKVRELYEEARKIRQVALDRGQTEVEADIAVSESNIAETFYKEGNYREAKKLYAQALSRCKKALGSRHPDTIQIRSNIARVYVESQRFDHAEQIYQQVLLIGKKTLGEDDPMIAARLNNLAALYHRQKKYDLALSYYEDALKIYKDKLGQVHPSVAAVLLNEANLLESKDKSYKKTAASLKKQARKIQEEHKQQNPVCKNDLN